MEVPTIRTTAVFSQPFRIPGFDELLPAGEHDIETEILVPPDHLDPDNWKAAVLIRLHPRTSHPGLARSLIAPGRDAADVPLMQTFGPNTMTDFRVWTVVALPSGDLVP